MSLVSDRSAVDLHGHRREPLRKVSEYEHNAQACLKLAAIISHACRIIMTRPMRNKVTGLDRNRLLASL